MKWNKILVCDYLCNLGNDKMTCFVVCLTEEKWYIHEEWRKLFWGSCWGLIMYLKEQVVKYSWGSRQWLYKHRYKNAIIILVRHSQRAKGKPSTDISQGSATWETLEIYSAIILSTQNCLNTEDIGLRLHTVVSAFKCQQHKYFQNSAQCLEILLWAE